MTISVLILTYNEEVNIADCLRSVTWSNDVVVLDSFSTDQTGEIARSFGARVAQRRFDDYASQRNFGLSELSYRNPWVLMLDADERVPVDLRDEMLHTVDTVPSDVCLLRMRRRDHLFGKWIRRSSGYPTWFGRIARVGRVRAERPYNEEIKTDGQVVGLAHHLDHFPFNKGFHDWTMKHDRYSSMEAALLKHGGGNWRWRQLFVADPAERRVAAKGLLYAIPFRPAVVFVGLYIVRGGIFEGRAGLTFCMLRSWYEFMINCKCQELQRRSQGLKV